MVPRQTVAATLAEHTDHQGLTDDEAIMRVLADLCAKYETRSVPQALPQPCGNAVPVRGNGAAGRQSSEGVRQSVERNPPTAVASNNSTSSRWTEVFPGGKMTRQGTTITLEAVGGHYTSEVGQYMFDFTTAHFTEDSCASLSFTVRTTARTGTYAAFGVGMFPKRDEQGRLGFSALVLHFSPTENAVYATFDKYLADTSCSVVRKLENVVPRHRLPCSRGDSINVACSVHPDSKAITCTIGSMKYCSGTKVPDSSTGGKGLVLFSSGGKFAIAKWINRNPAGGGAGQGVEDVIDPKLAELIESDILERSPNVDWDDVAGAAEPKRFLKEAIVLPLLVPEFFTGPRSPWKGVLLFGPPGTGKTLLAKAAATCTSTTFFNISPSTLVSRFHGESEKLCRTLFKLARKRAPAIIFFDEVDSLVSRRGDGHEHEASRRLKSELLSQLDGIESATAGGSRVIVIATTNRPWDLDEAVRRRLEKRIYIPLPDFLGRQQLFAVHLKGVVLEGAVDFDELASRTEGYSGADINQVCRDAAMEPMRRAVLDLSPAQIAALKERGELTCQKLVVTMGDLLGAIANVPASVSPAELGRYAAWMDEFGSK